MLECKFERTDIFCTLDHSAIRTGEDFRNEIVKNIILHLMICPNPIEILLWR